MPRKNNYTSPRAKRHGLTQEEYEVIIFSGELHKLEYKERKENAIKKHNYTCPICKEYKKETRLWVCDGSSCIRCKLALRRCQGCNKNRRLVFYKDLWICRTCQNILRSV